MAKNRLIMKPLTEIKQIDGTLFVDRCPMVGGVQLYDITFRVKARRK